MVGVSAAILRSMKQLFEWLGKLTSRLWLGRRSENQTVRTGRDSGSLKVR